MKLKTILTSYFKMNDGTVFTFKDFCSQVRDQYQPNFREKTLYKFILKNQWALRDSWMQAGDAFTQQANQAKEDIKQLRKEHAEKERGE